jgi:dihydrofolate synthase/folylpolyglutamate synthase
LLVAFERIDAARGADTLTFFEFNTLAALLIFETAAPDAIVLEVGMGGRLDAVNVVDADVAMISSIALDHCEWLGYDLVAIGSEKAGILRPGRPAIFGAREMPHSIESHAASHKSDLQRLGRDFDWARADTSWSWRHRSIRMDDLPLPALAGEAQLDNASAVLACLACLSDRLPVPREAIDTGLRTVELRGRFQRIEGNPEWVLDVAHNPAAARTLARSLARLPQRDPCIAVCGVLGDKDLRGIYAELEHAFDGWVIAGLPGPRALEPNALAERFRGEGADVLAVCTDVPSACARASEKAGPHGRIVVFGSFLTVGPASMWLEAEGGRHSDASSNSVVSH